MAKYNKTRTSTSAAVIKKRGARARAFGLRRKSYHRQYQIYGQYVAQEEIDIDKAIGGLNRLLQSNQL